MKRARVAHMLTYVADETLNSARKRRYSSRTECSDPNNKSRSVTKTINMQRAEEFNEEAKEQQVKEKRHLDERCLKFSLLLGNFVMVTFSPPCGSYQF